MTTQLTTTSPAAEPERPPRGRLKRLVLGRPSDPRWARPALWAVLALAAVLYSWDLSRNGDANTFYAAAVLSGTENWKAFFYGSLDSASFITVDKPPFAFWIMGISARVFGFNSWSLLLPQAAEGVAAVAVVYAAVRRSIASLTGERGAHAAALIAALALTLTPMVVAIDRDDNPDTMLTLLLASGAWALLESLRAGRTGKRPLLWLILSAVAFGLAFNTKMLEGFIALPALPVVYLIAADARLRTRIARLSVAGGVLAVITLSWMTIVDLIPKTSRPYVGSSSNDTVLESRRRLQRLRPDYRRRRRRLRTRRGRRSPHGWSREWHGPGRRVGHRGRHGPGHRVRHRNRGRDRARRWRRFRARWPGQLQRPRAPGRRGRRVWRPGGYRADVRLDARRPDLLAHPVRRHRADRDPHSHRPAPEDRPRAGQRAGVGRLVRAGVSCTQLPAGHSAPVLRQRDGSADRRADRHRRGGLLPGAPPLRLVESGAAAGDRRDRRVGFRTAAAYPWLEPVAAVGSRRSDGGGGARARMGLAARQGRRGWTGRASGAADPQAPLPRGGRGSWPDRGPRGARGLRGDAAVAGDRRQ